MENYLPIHTEGMRKNCLVCDAYFYKPTKYSQKQWGKKKYCSNKCGLIAINKNPDETIEDRFFSKVVRHDKKCWVWTGSKDKNAYGRLNVKGTPQLAHRVSWEIHKGYLEKTMVVRHMCDNPSCVNPDHLRLGTVQDNNNDALKSGRSQHNPQTTGERNTHSKMTELSVKLIRLAHNKGATTKELREITGLSPNGLKGILVRRTWKNV